MKKCVILNDTSYDFHHGCEIVMSNIIKLLKEIGIETIDTNPVGVNWINNKKFMQNMKNVDIVIVNGEGSLHHNSVRVNELAPIGKYVKENLHIPIVLINTTYQDNGPEIAKYMKYFDLIFVRECMSQNDLKQFNIISEIVPDMTFYTKFYNTNQHIGNDIGVTDSVYPHITEHLYGLAINNNYKYLPALTMPHFNRFKFYSIIGTIKFHLKRTIKIFFSKLGKPLDSYVSGTFYYIDNYYEYIQQISNLYFIIVGRYHSLCFSLKTGTPFFAIKSNSHKIEGMLEDIGISEGRIIEYDCLEKIHLKPFSEEEKQKIQKYTENAPLKIKQMFLKIDQLIS